VVLDGDGDVDLDHALDLGVGVDQVQPGYSDDVLERV